jgi:hypothetical protein
MTRFILATLVLLWCAAVSPRSASGQPDPPAVDPLHRDLDGVLDLYVRDGLVYYRALRQERARLDRYLQTIAGVSSAEEAGWSHERRLAFWINAYNAFVLQLVIDHYPIKGRSSQYPPGSIRQVPGAFDKRQFRAAGRQVTLDGLERDVLAPFADPRATLALGRGALGSGRLRSEAFTAERLDSQLEASAAEVVTRRELAYVDRQNDTLSVSPLFSWREAGFVERYAKAAPPVFATRSPLERAVVALIHPRLVRSELDFLDENTFRMVFHEFDWRLNELTQR